MRIYLFIIILSVFQNLHSQNMEANRCEYFSIDGILNEPNLNFKSYNFINRSPVFGKTSKLKTDISICYDNINIYISAKVHVKSKNINNTLSTRDKVGNSDYFGFYIDPIGNASEGFAFVVTSSGVQVDTKYGRSSSYREWDGIWDSSVKINAEYWAIEFAIPFNTLRFINKKELNFKVNFVQYLNYLNEQSWLKPINPKVNGFLNQFTELSGIENIKSPTNLKFFPFVSTVYDSNKSFNTKEWNYNAGLDVKYILNNQFTFDVSLVPDFSQTTFDDDVLNLSAFEVKFDENRNFFTEGTELFNKSDYFYTRRIGDEPVYFDDFDYDGVKENPESSPIISLLKITSKLKNGWNIGLLNGVEGREKAVLENDEKVISNPLTNYTSIAIDKNLQNNSSITLVSNSVIREGNNKGFNYTNLIASFKTKEQNYELKLDEAVSFSKQRGFAHKVELNKISGNFISSLYFQHLDENFNPNQFGFLRRNNRITYGLETQYNIYKPFWIFNEVSINLDIEKQNFQTLNKKELLDFDFYSDFSLINNWDITLGIEYTEKRDFFEPRVANRFINLSPFWTPYFEIASNTSKDLSFNTSLYLYNYIEKPFKYDLELDYNLSLRVNNNYRFTFGQSFYYSPFELGVYYNDSGTQFINDTNTISLISRVRNSIETNLNFSFLINNKMSTSLRLRHYYDIVDYQNLYNLNTNGNVSLNNDTNNFNQENINFNLLNLDFSYLWNFKRGRSLSLNFQKTISKESNILDLNYFRNFNSTFNSKGSYLISLKLKYYLDYAKITKKHNK
jgi:hypothetical protein